MKTGRVTYLGASLVLAGAVAVSCGGGGTATPPETPTTTGDEGAPSADEGQPAPDTGSTAEPEAATSGPPKPWKEMSADERKAYMAKAVLPKMAPQFTNFDAERFPTVTCKTCHGSGADKGTFAMPNPELGKLPPNGDLQPVIKKDPPLANFMMRNVVPNMVEVLGVEPYDQESGTGFGCYSCHTTK